MDVLNLLFLMYMSGFIVFIMNFKYFLYILLSLEFFMLTIFFHYF